MPLRVLSGVISNADGPVAESVVIGFNPHVVLSAPERVEVAKMRTIGPAGDFLDVPAEHVAMREINFRHPAMLLIGQMTRFFIDTQITLDQITIAWSKGSRTIGILPEISYMIIGEVEGSGSGYGGGGGGGSSRPTGPVGTPSTPVGDIGRPVTLPGGITGERK